MKVTIRGWNPLATDMFRIVRDDLTIIPEVGDYLELTEGDILEAAENHPIEVTSDGATYRYPVVNRTFLLDGSIDLYMGKPYQIKTE